MFLLDLSQCYYNAFLEKNSLPPVHLKKSQNDNILKYITCGLLV